MGVGEKRMNMDNYEEKATFFFFLAFLRHKIDHDHARQVDIARTIGVRSEYINRVYKGRQTCSVSVQEKICQYFGMLYLEALAMGRRLVETREIQPERMGRPGESQPLAVEHSRRLADPVSEADIVSIVSQLVARKNEAGDSLNKLRNILENMNDALIILDQNLVIEYQNRAHREIFGASRVGQTCCKANGREKCKSGCANMAARRTGMPAEGIYPAERGTYFALTSPVRDSSGQVTGFVQVMRDITQRHNLLAMALESLEMIDRGVILYAADRKILACNAKFREITGAGDRELASTITLLNFLRENRVLVKAEEMVEKIGKARRENREVSLEIPFSNGTRYRYTDKPLFAGEMCIGRIGVFIPAG